MSVNKIILIGHLGKDPELKEFQDGGKVANFSLATTERGFTTKNGQDIPERTQWHYVQVNGKMADVANQYLKKGSKIYLEGIVRYRKYTDSNNVERQITEIHVSTMTMLSPKPTTSSTATASTQQSNDNPFAGDEYDDLPF